MQSPSFKHVYYSQGGFLIEGRSPVFTPHHSSPRARGHSRSRRSPEAPHNLSCIFREAIKSNDPDQIRNALQHVKFHISTKEIDPKTIRIYAKLYPAMLRKEFEFPEKIKDEGAIKRWQTFVLSLKHERSPEILKKEGITGCGYDRFATALAFFLEEESPKTNSEVMVEESELEIFNAALENVQKSLKKFLKISAVINALKLLPFNKNFNYPALFEELLSRSLQKMVKKNKDFLIPLGWLLPDPYGGHLILSRISPVPNSDGDAVVCKVQLFNPMLTGNDTLLYSPPPTYNLAASAVFESSPPEEVLKCVYKLLALQIPKNSAYMLEINEKNEAEQKSITSMAARLNYLTFPRNPSYRKNAPQSPLDHIPYTPGNNCVSSSFRMMTVTVVKDHAESKPQSDHSTLHNLIDEFFELFCSYSENALSDPLSKGLIKAEKIKAAPPRSRSPRRFNTRNAAVRPAARKAASGRRSPNFFQSAAYS